MTGPTGPGRGQAWTTASPGDYPEFPYPGARPQGSWRLTASGRLHALQPLAGERARDLATGETVSLACRQFVLAYGSNANPQKLHGRFADQEILALEAEVEGWAAVWCSRRRDSGDIVCTLEPMAGARERHVVLAVTPAQLLRMDRWEGHPRAYERTRFAGRLSLIGTSYSPQVLVYRGTPGERPALLSNGRPLPCSEVSYSEVADLLQ